MPDRVKEELPENEQPVNQLAKLAILKLWETPDPDGLYFLQFIHLALDKEIIGLISGRDSPFWDLLSTIDDMLPEQLQNILGRVEDEEGPGVVMCPDPNWTPAELAGELINTLGIVAGEYFGD